MVEKALGARFRHFNEETSSLMVHDIVRVGETGTLSGISTTNVLRAKRAAPTGRSSSSASTTRRPNPSTSRSPAADWRR
ncbi:hypothetical protein SBADM41S_00270 [Streptomyces badius]